MLEPETAENVEVDLAAEANKVFDNWTKFNPKCARGRRHLRPTGQLVRLLLGKLRQSLTQESILAPMVWRHIPRLPYSP